MNLLRSTALIPAPLRILVMFSVHFVVRRSTDYWMNPVDDPSSSLPPSLSLFRSLASIFLLRNIVS